MTGAPASRRCPDILKNHKAREASVVLADQFVRYALLPWSESVKTREQWLALAKHRFSALHGAIAANWDVKVTETSPMGPRLACAVDRELIAEIAVKFVGGVNLISVQPFLVAAFNRIRHQVGNGSCWIVVEARASHARAHPARRLGRDPQPPRRRALAHRAARDPRARERVPRPRPAVHARHRVRAGRVRHHDPRRLARAR